MYTPTKEELEELGFVSQWNNIWLYVTLESWLITHWENTTGFHLEDEATTGSEFYPQSLEDIKTLIRLLTPQ